MNPIGTFLGVRVINGVPVINGFYHIIKGISVGTKPSRNKILFSTLENIKYISYKIRLQNGTQIV